MLKGLMAVGFSLAAAAAWPGPATTTSVPELGTIMLMQHVCPSPDVKSESDLAAIEQAGGGGLVGAVRRMTACPTVSLHGDDPSDGLAGPPATFDFRIRGGLHAQTLRDATYERAKLCELDLALDISGDGRWTDDACLDSSHYVFEDVPIGRVSIQQTVPPPGTRFGALRFTPFQLDRNNDRDALVSVADGRIELDTRTDHDPVLMLHVYNVQLEGAAQGRMPDSSTDRPQPLTMTHLALALMVGGAAFGTLLHRSMVWRRRRRCSANGQRRAA